MTGKMIVEAREHDSRYRIELNNVELTSNHGMSHCTGGTILHLIGDQRTCAEVSIFLEDKHIFELRDMLNGIIKWKKLEEDE